MTYLALLAIRFYQLFLSPYKGFRCAYGVHTGHASCSVLGYRAVRRFGVLQGLGLIDERMFRCGVAHRRHQASLLSRQAGSCDLPCDSPCDVADCFDAGDCCDLLGSWRKNRRNDGRNGPHIPPRRTRRPRQDRQP